MPSKTRFAFWIISWILLVLIGVFTPGYIGYDFILIPLGLFFIVYGLILKAVSVRDLKKYGHLKMKGAKAPKKLVTKGIYSCMRHPALFGSVLIGVGLSLATRNIFSILAAGWYVAAAMYFVFNVEERDVYKKFGKKYMEYVKRVPPFRFWCGK